jgi:hypothetical protein
MIVKRDILRHVICETKKCRHYSKDEKFAVTSKNNRVYRLVNETSIMISRFDIDDCIFKDIKGTIDGFTLCDNIFVLYDNEIEAKPMVYIWIELKGVDVNHACRQLFNTMKNALILENGIKNYIRIICSRNIKPVFRSSEYKLFLKQYPGNGQFIVQSNKIEETTRAFESV